MTDYSKWFEFTSEEESVLFNKYMSYIKDLADKNTKELENYASEAQKRLLSAIEAFGLILGKVFSSANSGDLYKFYHKFREFENVEEEINEIVVDTIYDIARFRSSTQTSSEVDQHLYSVFKSYNGMCEVLIDFQDGMINSLMSLYEIQNASPSEKRIKLIREIIPIVTYKALSLKAIWSGSKEKKWMLLLVYNFKNDLTAISRNASSRFKSFFNENELSKICAMSSEQLQLYLANLIIERPNLKESKNLLKEKNDADFLLKELSILENTLYINDEMLEQVFQQYTQANKNLSS